MTDLRKAAEMALELLEIHVEDPRCEVSICKTIATLRQALAQPEQEPVAHLWECIGRWVAMVAHDGKDANLAPPDWLIDAVKAATAPPERGWVGLTDEEIDDWFFQRLKQVGAGWRLDDVIRAVEAKLKEKNT